MSKIKEKLNVTFSDLNLSVKVGKPWKKSIKPILQDVSGYCESGQMLAIMGASGAGKTTLLNVLSGRAVGQISGKIKINGHEVSPKQIKAISSFVMQDDLLLHYLTVRETIAFSAKLKVRGLTTNEKMQRVDRLVDELQLKKVRDTIIGDPLNRGVSGGERKRTNIANEIVSDPALIFLDEPTTGLDSFSALSVIQTMRHLCASGRTIITTIHQPRSNIYALFDMLLLLGAGGRVAYFGSAKDVVQYFSKLNFMCPEFSNPADFLIDITSVDSRNDKMEADTKLRLQHILDAYPKSKHNKKKKERIEEIDKQEYAPLTFPYGFASNYFYQLGLLSLRSLRGMNREKFVYIITLIQSCLFAFIIGFVFYQIGDDQSTITDRAGLLFMVIVNQIFGSVFGTIASFGTERPVLLKERNSRLYRVSPYYFTKSLADFIVNAIVPICFGIIVYWLAGLRRDFCKFLIFEATLVLVTWSALSLALFVASLFKTPQGALAIAPVAVIVFLLFGGFYAANAEIPAALNWIQWISFIHYAYTILMRNEFTGLTLVCTQSQTINGVCQFTTGEQVLDQVYSMKNDVSIGYGFLWLSVILVTFRLFGYLSFRFIVR